MRACYECTCRGNLETLFFIPIFLFPQGKGGAEEARSDSAKEARSGEKEASSKGVFLVSQVFAAKGPFSESVGNFKIA